MKPDRRAKLTPDQAFSEARCSLVSRVMATLRRDYETPDRLYAIVNGHRLLGSWINNKTPALDVAIYLAREHEWEQRDPETGPTKPA
jgi:hypothetical protein